MCGFCNCSFKPMFFKLRRRFIDNCSLIAKVISKKSLLFFYQILCLFSAGTNVLSMYLNFTADEIYIQCSQTYITMWYVIPTTFCIHKFDRRHKDDVKINHNVESRYHIFLKNYYKIRSVCQCAIMDE